MVGKIKNWKTGFNNGIGRPQVGGGLMPISTKPLTSRKERGIKSMWRLKNERFIRPSRFKCGKLNNPGEKNPVKIIQKILKFILPKNYFFKIEEESKKWFITCGCGYEQSVWEAGGLRAYATCNNKPALGYCPMCRKLKIMRLIKKEA